MNSSRVYVNELRQPEAEAWTAFLKERTDHRDLVVKYVAKEALNEHGLNRYLLTFAGHNDAFPLIGKKTNATEARFYSDLAGPVRRLLPQCWLNHVGHDWSWVVLDDIPNHTPAPRWTSDDAEKIVALLASFHGAYWDHERWQSPDAWPEPFLGRHNQNVPDAAALDAWRYWEHAGSKATTVSSHALRSAGRLAPTLIRAAAGVELLRQLGGWPGVVERPHLEAFAELLDDPLPMLQPLRELPITLLHGNLALQHWHSTLFNERFLLDWANVTAGPSVCDLVDFLEQMEWMRAEREGFFVEEDWPVSEETIVDSYLLRMHVGLGQFYSRAMLQAIPAALCLHVITTWLPRFAEAFRPFVGSPLTWRHLLNMDDAQLRRAGYERMIGWRPYLRRLLPRFWRATRLL